jgi:hypothetical protein
VGLDLMCNDDYFTPGEQFTLQLRVANYGPAVEGKQFVLLDVYGSYWFHPGWTQELDYVVVSLPEGFDQTITILDFQWPATNQSADGIVFWAAITDAAMVDLLSNVDKVSFGFGPA